MRIETQFDQRSVVGRGQSSVGIIAKQQRDGIEIGNEDIQNIIAIQITDGYWLWSFNG